MTPSDVCTEVRNRISAAEKSLLPWFDEPADLLDFRPGSDRWTAAEILEHIVLTSRFLLVLIRKAKTKALRNTQNRSLEEVWSDYQLVTPELDEVGLWKSFPWIRPDHMEPTGELPLLEVKRVFLDQMKECREILEEIKAGEGALYKTTMTVNGIGKLDVYQYMVFLCLHALRHVTQLEANRSAMQNARG